MRHSKSGKKESPDNSRIILLPLVTDVMTKAIKKRNKFTY